jgi:hypothetical protein
MTTATDTETLSAESERGDSYLYRVVVSRNQLQHKRSGSNPATLYRHAIDRWTPKRVFVEKGPEAVTEGDTAPRWERDQEGCFSLDRAELQENGKVYHRPARDSFYLHREDAEAVVQKHEPETPECLEMLGLDRAATEGDIRDAFRVRSKELHPDHGGDPAAFRRLRDAYEKALKRTE